VSGGNTPPPHPEDEGEDVVINKDSDPNWEDEDILEGQATTHRSRNPHARVLLPRQRTKRVKGKNAYATAAKRRELRAKKTASLDDDLRKYHESREAEAVRLSKKHGVKLVEVRRRMLMTGGFKKPRDINMYNAKVSAIMRRLNEGSYNLPAHTS
jgi:hypothetical protein